MFFFFPSSVQRRSNLSSTTSIIREEHQGEQNESISTRQVDVPSSVHKRSSLISTTSIVKLHCIKEETYCCLYIPSSVLAGEKIACATATVYPIGDGTVHFKKLLKGHMKVSVIKVVEIHKSMELPVPDDEIPNLESAVKGFIQWPIAAIARFTGMSKTPVSGVQTKRVMPQHENAPSTKKGKGNETHNEPNKQDKALEETTKHQKTMQKIDEVKERCIEGLSSGLTGFSCDSIIPAIHQLSENDYIYTTVLNLTVVIFLSLTVVTVLIQTWLIPSFSANGDDVAAVAVASEVVTVLIQTWLIPSFSANGDDVAAVAVASEGTHGNEILVGLRCFTEFIRWECVVTPPDAEKEKAAHRKSLQALEDEVLSNRPQSVIDGYNKWMSRGDYAEPYAIRVNKEVFRQADESYFAINATDIIELLTNKELECGILTLFEMSLYHLKGHSSQNKVGFLNPGMITADSCFYEKWATIDYLTQSLTGYDFYLAPYLQGRHYVLFIICPKHGMGFILNSSKGSNTNEQSYRLAGLVESVVGSRTMKWSIERLFGRIRVDSRESLARGLHFWRD
ncbi:ulp1 protease family, C-terminal catalytic domain-containing protein [Tanacetum coccineum]